MSETRYGDAVTSIDVLLVEDDPGDVLMTREAFAEHGMTNRLAVVSDGVEALAYLRREGEYAGAVRPDLVLLGSARCTARRGTRWRGPRGRPCSAWSARRRSTRQSR
jgi:hypothetical protein